MGLTPEQEASFREHLKALGHPDPDADWLEEAIRGVTLERFKAGRVLIREGEESADAFIVHSGLLHVTRKGSDGQPRPVAELGPGEIVGEMALLTGLIRKATVTVMQDSDIYVVTERSY